MASKSEAHSKGATQGDEEGHGSGGKNKKGLLLVAGTGVLMLALGGGGAWYFLSGKKDTAGADGSLRTRSSKRSTTLSACGAAGAARLRASSTVDSATSERRTRGFSVTSPSTSR